VREVLVYISVKFEVGVNAFKTWVSCVDLLHEQMANDGSGSSKLSIEL